GVKQLMAVRAPKHEKRPRLAGACGDCLLLRGQGNGRVPQNGLLTGGRDTLLSATSQSTDHPLLSTPLRALPKPLISVLGVCQFNGRFHRESLLYCRTSRVYTAIHWSAVCCPWCRQACWGSEDAGAQSLA